MKIGNVVIAGIKIDVMDYFATFSIREFSVFPFPPIAVRSIPKTLRLVKFGMRSISLGDSGISGDMGLSAFCHRANHCVTPAFVCPIWQAVLFLLIRIQGISVAMPHLVMTSAHPASHNWALTVFTCTSDNFSSPPILWTSVLSDALIVHQAESVRYVLSSTLRNGAFLVKFWRCHIVAYYSTVKALGNSMAVPVLRYLGERILAVEKIMSSAAKHALRDHPSGG